MNRVLGGLSVLLMATGVWADAPRLVHFQGRLSTSAGANLTDPVNLRLRLYPHPTNLTPVLFDESHTNVALVNGLFSVFIGSQTGGGVPDAAATGADVFLGVSVNGAAELSPRTRVATAPFALFSNSGGLLPPSMTSAQRDAIAGPAPGLMIYNTDTNCLDMWVGSTWKQACFDCAFQSPTADSNSPVCVGSLLQLSATNLPGATYAWTGPNGFSSSQMSPTISGVTTEAAGTYTVTVTKEGCTAEPSMTTVVVNSLPGTPGPISGDAQVCAGEGPVIYSISPVADASSYTWTVPPGSSITSGQGTIEITVTFGTSSGSIIVAAVNGCGNSTDSVFPVVVVDPDSDVLYDDFEDGILDSNRFVFVRPNECDGGNNWSESGGAASASCTCTSGNHEMGFQLKEFAGIDWSAASWDCEINYDFLTDPNRRLTVGWANPVPPGSTISFSGSFWTQTSPNSASNFHIRWVPTASNIEIYTGGVLQTTISNIHNAGTLPSATIRSGSNLTETMDMLHCTFRQACN